MIELPESAIVAKIDVFSVMLQKGFVIIIFFRAYNIQASVFANTNDLAVSLAGKAI